MRVTAAFSRLLRVPGVWVRGVVFEPDRVVVTVASRRKKLECPKCSYSTQRDRDHHPIGLQHNPANPHPGQAQQTRERGSDTHGRRPPVQDFTHPEPKV